MKPNFALSLSFDGIRLLLRAAGGWQLVGEVDVSDPDMPDALAALRGRALALRPEGIYTKLIIPDAQIRYLSTETGPLSETKRSDAARAALEGTTPYPVDALAFDICADGTTTHIAAVARETLVEAEAFATEHHFNPISFVAAPDSAGFLGEPFFGVTAQSRSLLQKGDAVEADGIRVVIVGPAPSPDYQSDDVNDPTGTGSSAQPLVLGEDTLANAPTGTEGETADPQDSQSPPLCKIPDPDPDDADDDAQSSPLHADEAAPTQPVPRAQADVDQAPDDTAAQVDEPHAKEANETKGINHPQTPPDKAGANANAKSESGTPLGFASRRGSKNPAAAALGGVTRKIPSAPPPLPTQDTNAPSSPPQATVDSLRPIEAPIKPVKARTGDFMSRRKPRPARQRDVAVQTSAQDAPSVANDDASRMASLADRETSQIKGKPRYLGLFLTVALLIFLAGVAAWAAFFLDDGLARLFQGRERTLASTPPEQPLSTPPEHPLSTLPEQPMSTPTDEVEAPLVATDEAVERVAIPDIFSENLAPEDAAVLDALRDPLPDPEDVPAALDGSALDARYAVTGIWTKAPDAIEPTSSISLDDLYITSIDPISPALDAVALPVTTSFQTDEPLAVVSSPVAAGTNFALGEDGRVIPTVAGTLSPDGHTVFLGRPALVPPPTPVRFATDPTENETLQILTQVRPRARPSDLIEQNERATLGGLSRSELAGLRPRLRPQALQQQEEEKLIDTPADAPPSALATDQSRRPKKRPQNFANVVARAAPSPASTAVVTTTTRVTPSIPSSASVSREATLRNAINLRKVNLIGVYGKPSDRRALVRLSNGRYRKVQVGDRIDGGRVSAIGEGELRYQKGSRSLVLKMPKG